MAFPLNPNLNYPNITPLQAAEAALDADKKAKKDNRERYWYQRHFVWPYLFVFAVNTFAIVSFPFLPTTTLFIVQTEFPTPITGTLNGIVVNNLTNIRVSLAHNY
jgi:hypothetical protein